MLSTAVTHALRLLDGTLQRIKTADRKTGTLWRPVGSLSYRCMTILTRLSDDNTDPHALQAVMMADTKPWQDRPLTSILRFSDTERVYLLVSS